MIPIVKSLNIRLLLIVVCFVAATAFLSALRQHRTEIHQLQVTYDSRLVRLGASYQKRVEEELRQRQNLLESAHEIFNLRMLGKQRNPAPEDFTLVRDPDQGYRSMDGLSGVFVHKDMPVDQNTRYFAYHTQTLWEGLVPLLRTSFNAFYFITPQRMTRIWPAEIVQAHKPDHDVTQEIFFTLATPAKNPSREARWTPIYFDLYTRMWTTSLLIPVYDNDKFLGVMGADLDVTFLFEKLADLDIENDGIRAFIFDDKQHLILQSDQQKILKVSVLKDYTLFDEREPVNADIAGYIQQAVTGERQPAIVETYVIDTQPHNISYRQIDEMSWDISLHYPLDVIDQKFRPRLFEIYFNILLLTIVFSFILYYGLKYFVTDRISRLAKATAKIDQYNWQQKVPEQGRDEIGLLGKTINTMLAKINDLVTGLNSNIQQLERANVTAEKLTSAIESTSSLVVILNQDWVVEYANPYFWRTSGYSAEEELRGENALLLDKNNDEHPKLNDIYQSLLKESHPTENGGNDSEWRAEYLAQRKDGSHFWLMQTISAVLSDDGDMNYLVCVGQDVSDLKHNQKKMEQLAYYDQLTGLHNRVLFKDQLRAALHLSERDQSHFALMYLDLDHFKRINDTLGHEAGDNLLIEIAERLKSCLRAEDIVARLGGDEFAILLHQVGSAQYAYVVANKIINSLNRPIMLVGQEVVVGVSIGITMVPEDSKDIDTLMKNADLAMYQAKEKGRNTFQFYTANMNYEVEYRLSLERGLRQALKFQQFELYFQPIIDLKTREIVSAEALIRWNHPERGVISPAEFIPIAEETGLIVPLGKWVIRAACQQAKNIQKALRRPLKIAVNISARQLNDPDFPEEFRLCLAESNLAPEWLELEVTESTLMVEGTKGIDRLKQIRDLGVNLAIDDFGTGYSSLSYLKRLPVQSLKVDRSFVEGLPNDEEDRAITTLIVAMASSLGYKVVVEGVETVEQLRFLTECGCDYAQGFFFSKPLAADEFMQLLFKWSNDSYPI